MIDALVSGRLAGDPKLGISHNGTEYATVLLWVPVGLSHLSVSAVAFDPAVVDELLTLSAGDAVAVLQRGVCYIECVRIPALFLERV